MKVQRPFRKEVGAQGKEPRSAVQALPDDMVCTSVKAEEEYLTRVLRNTWQNIPRPENDYWNLRDGFITLPGWKIVCADYSQLEMRLLAAAACAQDMIDIFIRDWDIHCGNAALMYSKTYEDIFAGNELKKKLKDMSDEDLIHAAEALSPGITSRCAGNLKAYLKLCASHRADAKNIGFGQPTSQAEVKPAQNGETYGRLVYGNPVLPNAMGSVSTWRRRSPQCRGATALGSHSLNLH